MHDQQIILTCRVTYGEPIRSAFFMRRKFVVSFECNAEQMNN